MGIFKKVTLRWWQTGLIKLVSVCLGLVIGANWPGFFAQYTVALLVIAVLAAIYLVTMVWAKQ